MKKLHLSKRFDNALLWATYMHAGQLRKGTGIPYISHLLAVVSIVVENGDHEDEVIGALLHDAAEDQGGRETLEKIRHEFGEKVSEIVEACTDTFEDPKPDWMPRKEKYIAHLPNASESAQLVSLADKLHNARAILIDYQNVGEELWNRFNASKEDILWYYSELVKTFKIINSKKHQYLVKEFEDVVNRIEQLANPNLGISIISVPANKMIGINKIKKGSSNSTAFFNNIPNTHDKPIFNEYASFETLNEVFYYGKEGAVSLDDIIEVINKHRDPEKNFNSENKHIDLIACYRPYHIYKNSFGIYIQIENFCNFILSILDETSFSFLDARIFALQIILEHERFHYLTELYITNNEISSSNYNLFLDYHENVYEKVFRTEKCFEETLANHFAKMVYYSWDNNRLQYLRNFFERQPNGYRQANLVNKKNQTEYFVRFEDQILERNHNNISFSQIINTIIPLPLGKFQIGKRLNIPIYIEDDTSKGLDQKLLDVLFPIFRDKG